MKCGQCGKEIIGEGIAFCPYCGAKLPALPAMAGGDSRAAEWVRKALAVTSLPERKKILEKAKNACPDAPEIDWEMLFIGHKNPKPPRGKMDFSIIKSHLLQIYRMPEDFSGEERNRMRTELFEDPLLISILQQAKDPEEKMKEYLLRLCREYIDIFLEEDNRLMGSLFGFRTVRNKEKIIGGVVSEMIRRIALDDQLAPERQLLLKQAMIQAFTIRSGGKTEFLVLEGEEQP